MSRERDRTTGLRYGMPWPSRGWGYIIGHNDFHNDPTQAIELSPQLGDDAINVRAAVQAD